PQVARRDARYRAPAIRAYWPDNPLKPDERSTLFGFTSDFPPTYEDVRIRGNSRLAIGGAVGPMEPDVRAATLGADGEVPTPIAFDAPGVASSVSVGLCGIGTPGGTVGGRSRLVPS